MNKLKVIEAEKLQNLNIISFKDKKIFLDNTEIKGVTDIEIKKHADDIADVILKIKSSIKDLDDD
ncbi:hypothetical protein QYC35_05820 [Ligilactobacillus salivarius]|uniref:Uncharacterized protein n=1 Tax=Ligilactobacillus salivarius TaxID=1624 RepID=A0AAW7N7Z3_9LACO|nr:hypothetical protein [Ligilactobacillus salivarius]MDN4833754.1 hypothetical protein [Ligilactobacillus salivarius]